MTIEDESFRLHLPFYLTADPQAKELVRNLQDLVRAGGTGYFHTGLGDGLEAQLLQGDGRTGFQIFSFETGEKRSLRGMVLSNSCDVSPDNTRDLPPIVTFAPLVRLSRLIERFERANLSTQSVNSKVAAIKAQSVTTMFYLPQGEVLDGDYVVLLADLHSMPVSKLLESSSKVFSLNMPAFYLLAFKLSVHFCRLHENVPRSLQ